MARVGFHIGPFYFSQRLGGTQAQRRAAARAQAQRRAARQEERDRKRAIREAQRPEAIAARQAQHEENQRVLEEYRRQREEREARTRRGVITERRIDPLDGGSFNVRFEDTEMAFGVTAKDAIRFLPLKKGDVVAVAFAAPGKTGVEDFRQLSRANGAQPRSPVTLTDAELERLSVTAKTSPPRDS